MKKNELPKSEWKKISDYALELHEKYPDKNGEEIVK